MWGSSLTARAYNSTDTPCELLLLPRGRERERETEGETDRTCMATECGMWRGIFLRYSPIYYQGIFSPSRPSPGNIPAPLCPNAGKVALPTAMAQPMLAQAPRGGAAPPGCCLGGWAALGRLGWRWADQATLVLIQFSFNSHSVLIVVLI